MTLFPPTIYLLSQKQIRVVAYLFVFIISLLFAQYNFAQSTSSPFKNWEFRKKGDTAWHTATVPGTVHTDLYNNKLIPDPFYGLNEYEMHWIEKSDWEYKCAFDVAEETFSKTHISLVFEGLDTYANVYLNDSLVLTADNMFRGWEAECKKFLKRKNNQLHIIFESAVNRGIQDSLRSKIILPGGSRVFTRKAQYQYGWDWSPRYVTCGIWKPAYIKAWNDIKIHDVQFYQDKVTAEKANLHAIVYAESDKYQDCKIVIKQVNGGMIIKEQTTHLAAGANRVIVKFDIEDPQLWWTNGLGKPYLYHFETDIYKGSQKIYSDSCRIGIRTVELVQQPDPAGKSFYFKLNGVPVFMKGANFIPPDNFLPRVTKTDYEKLVSDAAECNMNMLRVWGGGVYEDDYFYELCDEKGIMVLQDFMFACAMYPGDLAFLDNVKSEAIYQVRRLRNHPCIALWCGNNEISEGWHNWGWQKQYGYSAADSAKIWHDYITLFDTIIKDVVDHWDVQRPYWPSSPKYGWGRKQSLLEGDSHYWGVWWGMEPFSVYEKKVGRFMSEYGFQAFPDEQTLQTYLDPKLSPAGDNMNAYWHNKHPLGTQTIDTYLLRDYAMGSDDKKDIKQYIYLSQLSQAYGIAAAIKAHRRAAPYCMGTLYWQYNDCWPGVSWSGMDHDGKWKALQYFVKKAFQPVALSVTRENDMMKIVVISDRPQGFKGVVKCRLMGFTGKKYWEKETTVKIDAGKANYILTLPLSEMIKDTSVFNSIVFSAQLYSADTLSCSDQFYFRSPKDLKLPKATISKKLITDNSGTYLHLKTKSLAKNVYISFDDKYLKLPDNYFDMLPGDKMKIRIEGIPNAKAGDFKLRMLNP